MNSISILILTFNRPELLRNTLDKLLESSHKLAVFVSVDGPKPNSNQENYDSIKHLLSEKKYSSLIIKTQIASKNYGVERGVVRGIDWFFSNVNEGIILEDDLDFSDSFISYCAYLLPKYRDNQQIMMISGNNHFPEVQTQHSYFYSRHCLIWGWATWKNRWEKYKSTNDDKANILNDVNLINNLKCISSPLRITNTLLALQNKIDTWDYTWNLAMYLNNGLSIIPSKNLVVNVGFGKDSTHTKIKTFQSHESYESDFEISSEPSYAIHNCEFDKLVLRYEYPLMLLLRTLFTRFL